MNDIYLSQTAIIIVLFHPCESDIDNIYMLSKIYKGVVVDNSEKNTFNDSHIGRMLYLPLKENYGIAGAHNQAINLICHDNCVKYIVLLDQDSRLTEDYPLKIVNEFIQIKSHNPQLVALGPTIIQKETGEEYRSAIHHDQYSETNFILKKDIIASGCCLNVDGFKTVGEFDTSLFIDFVDTEWCYRAKSKGFVFGITPNILLRHKVGKSEIHIGKHIVSISAPFRYYYQYRNFIILLFRKYVPFSFKVNFGIKFLLRLLYFPIFVQDGWKCCKYMLKGILTGLRTITTKSNI